MEGQHPLTIALLAVCAVLALVVLAYVGRLAAAITVGLATRGRHAFDTQRYAAGHGELAAAVRALTAAEAAAEAEQLLMSSEYLVTEPGPAAVPVPAALAQRQRELLRRFRAVAAPYSGVRLAADEVGPAESWPGHLRLGPGSTDGHVELVTPAGEERVLEVEDGAVALEHPTIDHLLVYLHRDAELYVECATRAV